MSQRFLSEMDDRLDDIEDEMKELTNVFLNDYTLDQTSDRKRCSFKGGCLLSRTPLGPTARGSGLELDVRSTGYLAYGDIGFKPVVEKDGDGYARCAVRCRELFQSVEIIRRVMTDMPDGEVFTAVKGNPDGEYFSRSEQPRGEVIHYLKGNGTKNLAQFRVRTPTLTNFPLLYRFSEAVNLRMFRRLFLRLIRVSAVWRGELS